MTRDEALEHAAVIVGATDLPVNGDLENGFGDDPESVAETIRGAAAAGLVGCSIEDSTSAPGDPIYPLAQAVERIAAARRGGARRCRSPFMLTARAENYLHGRSDLDDTIARLQAFEKAGADVLYAPGLRDIEDIRTVCAAVSKPVNVLALRGRAERRAALGGRRPPRQPRLGILQHRARSVPARGQGRAASTGRSGASTAPRPRATSSPSSTRARPSSARRGVGQSRTMRRRRVGCWYSTRTTAARL